MVYWIQRWKLGWSTGVTVGMERGEKVLYIFLRLLGRVETKGDSQIYYFNS